MKIFWTYILNTNKEKTANSILNEVLANHKDAHNIAKEIYWKDNSKYSVTFYTVEEAFDLNTFVCQSLIKISSNWNFIITEELADISAVSDSPKNYKVAWVSFSMEE